MKYLRAGALPSDVLVHLRNKNITVVPSSGGVFTAVAARAASLERRVRALSLRRGLEVVVSEQIVEHPLVLRHLRERDRTVLDFGGYESLLPLQLSALGVHVVVLDRRPYPFQHPNLEVICADLFVIDPAQIGQFDAVISISTIEHLGWGRYGDVQVETDADIQGARILWGLVKDGGRLIATVPAGRPAVQRGYRVYDEGRLRQVFPFATSIRWYAKGGRGQTWVEVPPGAVHEHVYQAPHAVMPVEAVAFVLCEK